MGPTSVEFSCILGRARKSHRTSTVTYVNGAIHPGVISFLPKCLVKRYGRQYFHLMDITEKCQQSYKDA